VKKTVEYEWQRSETAPIVVFELADLLRQFSGSGKRPGAVDVRNGWAVVYEPFWIEPVDDRGTYRRCGGGQVVAYRGTRRSQEKYRFLGGRAIDFDLKDGVRWFLNHAGLASNEDLEGWESEHGEPVMEADE
jgi:hypothetical protein